MLYTHHGFEVSWKLGPCASVKTYGSYTHYPETCCLQSGQQTLECKDSGGDGWKKGYIEIQGKRYCDKFNDGSLIMKQITITT